MHDPGERLALLIADAREPGEQRFDARLTFRQVAVEPGVVNGDGRLLPDAAQLGHLEWRESPPAPGRIDQQRADQLLLGEQRHEHGGLGVEQSCQPCVEVTAEAELAGRVRVCPATGDDLPDHEARRVRAGSPGPGVVAQPHAGAQQLLAFRV